MSLADKNVLVVGGGGFIGSHLVDRLIEEYPKSLAVLDSFYLGKDKQSNLDWAKRQYPALKIVNGDASKLAIVERLLKLCEVDVVFDLAVACLPMSLMLPKRVFNMNCQIASALSESLRRDLYDVLVHFSSSEVYGDAAETPMTEAHTLKPSTPYAASKIAADHLILSYVKTFGVEATIIRPFNTMGPRQNAGSYAGVIPATVTRILRGEAPVIFGDGLQTRDYSYVSDVADAAVQAYQARATRGKVVNVASGREVRILDLVSQIAALTGCTRPIVYEPARVGDVRRFVGSNLLAKRLFGYRPKVPFAQGLRRTVKWYMQQKKGRMVEYEAVAAY